MFKINFESSSFLQTHFFQDFGGNSYAFLLLTNDIGIILLTLIPALLQ